MLAASLLLGGLLPLNAHTRDQWAPTGAWRLPVGDAYAIAEDRPQRPGPFFILRSVEYEGGRASHQGADLGSGQAGALVHAAAAGLVVSAQDHGEYGGYGTHVVLAHRLPGGVLAYTVYAHMRIASLRVHAGQRVQAGQLLGRVGMTGHATTPHLHFELRSADDPSERWEFGRVEDPLAFIEARLPRHRADTTGVEALLEWGECAALLPPGTQDDDALTHEAWWRMLAAAVKGPLLDPLLDADALRDSLIVSRILPEEGTSGLGGAAASWREVARDAARARHLGLRTGTSPLRKLPHHEACMALLGSPTPATHTAMLASYTGQPTLAQAVVLIADIAGAKPDPPKPAKPVQRSQRLRIATVKMLPDSLRADTLPPLLMSTDSSRARTARPDSLHERP